MINHKYYNLHTVSFIYTDVFSRRLISFCLLLVAFTFLLLYSFQPHSSTNQLQSGIASEIIRFHVIANSDSMEDQALKLKVKDALTEELRPSLASAKDIKEARTLLLGRLTDLELLSNEIIKESGYEYTAVASLEHGYFPLKVYGDLSLPPGEYEAIRIELGSAIGQNWWCIMFPPLCFVDATYNVVPDSSKEQLEYLLTEEEYDAIFSKDEVNIKIKFKLLPWLEKFFK